ncbi:cupin domain-containing protein [Salinilacihabitans rarus]|uniref:cupin domain-containing protein n=1 Tax=Salinilacihabitans rarus TaxID=2961596 RepID=UPI0020C83769|nr:cupin domain-containing protein [Salinilacihabitans rarus]
MYSMVTLENVEPRELEGQVPTLLPVGYELRPEEMRPNVWQYEAGEENAFHRQTEQEELYVVLDGAISMTVERGDDRDVLELEPHDVVVVPPHSWRQLRAVEPSTVLVVGAPNVKDDAVVEE